MLKEIIAALILLSAAPSFASAWSVQMVNYGEQRGMLFQAQLGDSVTFVAAHSGPNGQSHLLPEGYKQWKSALDQLMQKIILA